MCVVVLLLRQLRCAAVVLTRAPLAAVLFSARSLDHLSTATRAIRGVVSRDGNQGESQIRVNSSVPSRIDIRDI